jgi:predicted DNA-binding transcriptional regulator AlpA
VIQEFAPMGQDDDGRDATRPPAPYLDKRQLVSLSGLSASTIQRYKRDGTIPFFQPGGRGCAVRFPRDAIEAARQQAASDFGADAGVLSRQHQAVSAAGKANGSGKLPGPRPRWQRPFEEPH